MKEQDAVYNDILEIFKTAKRSAELTRQLLAFARKQAINPRVLDLNESISDMQKMLDRLIGEGIELVWLPGGKLWKVKMDPAQVSQILINILINSRDAIAGPGMITIETSNVTLSETDCTGKSQFRAGDYVLLAVRDNGVGMDKEVLDRLFEPFFTTKEIGKGTGLGLATVYGIVRQNNGFIDVISEKNRGTAIRIYVPKNDTPEAVAEIISRPPEQVTGSETVLFVEDEEAIIGFGKLTLEKFGYRVLTAQHPMEAIDIVKTTEENIQLLITDVIMPDMNGKDMAKIIHELRPDIRCLYMSGYPSDVIVHEGSLEEGVNFIQKPFTVKELTEKVRQVLDA